MNIDYSQLVTAEALEEAAVKEANEPHIAYLRSTDWYVIRKLEIGTPVPEDVLEERAVARAAIKE